MDATKTGEAKPTDEGVSFELATSRYWVSGMIAASGLVPVQVSLKAPKSLRYELTEAAPLLFPRWDMLKLGYDDYPRRYRHHLHKTGVRRIREQLEAISRRNGGRGLALLCYEDVAVAGEWCHRTLFAEWWEQKTGQKLEELGGVIPAEPVDLPKPEKAKKAKGEDQLLLFA